MVEDFGDAEVAEAPREGGEEEAEVVAEEALEEALEEGRRSWLSHTDTKVCEFENGICERSSVASPEQSLCRCQECSSAEGRRTPW